MKPIKIFVVDDDPIQLEMITDHLGKFKNFTFQTFATGEKLLDKISEKPDIVILDYNLDSVDKDAMEGIDVLQEIKKLHEKAEVIMYSGQDSIEVAVETMRFGAFDYVSKTPSAFYRMENIIHRIIKFRQIQSDAKRYKLMVQMAGYGVVIAVALTIILKLMGIKVFGWVS
ncbi:MAG: response regulator [Bacteroidota bacterium]|nr:response regulator [Bacteroidota bacterium]